MRIVNRLKPYLLQHFSSYDLFLIFQNSGWLFFEKIGRLGLSFVVNVFIVRYLGPHDFGEIAYALSYLAIFQALATLGFEGITIREISIHPNRSGSILGTAFVLRVASSLVLFFAAVIIQYISSGKSGEALWIVLVICLQMVFQVGDCIDYWFQSQSNSKRTVSVKLMATIFCSAIKIYLIFIGADVIYFAAALTFESALVALGLLISYIQYSCQSRWSFDKIQAKFLLRESWPFMFSAFINIIQARIEFLAIKFYLGSGAVGQYAVALSLIEIFDVLGVIITNSIFPRIARISGVKINALMRLLYAAAVLIYLAILPALILCFFLFLPIYGEDFNQAKYLYLMFLIRPMLAYIGLVRGIYLRLSNRNIYAASSSMTGMMVAVFGSIFFIPLFGIYGAALSAILSYLISNFFMDFIYCKRNFFNIVHFYRLRP